MAKGFKQELESASQARFARRSAFEIRMDILRVAAEGCTKPTQILYRSNTSWMVLRKNLEALTSAGFMTETATGSRTAYSATDKGVALLQSYCELLDQARIAPEGGD